MIWPARRPWYARGLPGFVLSPLGCTVVLAAAISLLLFLWFHPVQLTPTRFDREGLPDHQITLSEIESRPEAKLAYPNGIVTGHFSNPESPGIEGTNWAADEHIIGSSDQIDTVVSWYQASLRARGLSQCNGFGAVTQYCGLNGNSCARQRYSVKVETAADAAKDQDPQMNSVARTHPDEVSYIDTHYFIYANGYHPQAGCS